MPTPDFMTFEIWRELARCCSYVSLRGLEIRFGRRLFSAALALAVFLWLPRGPEGAK